MSPAELPECSISSPEIERASPDAAHLRSGDDGRKFQWPVPKRPRPRRFESRQARGQAKAPRPHKTGRPPVDSTVRSAFLSDGSGLLLQNLLVFGPVLLPRKLLQISPQPYAQFENGLVIFTRVLTEILLPT